MVAAKKEKEEDLISDLFAGPMGTEEQRKKVQQKQEKVEREEKEKKTKTALKDLG